VTTDDGVLSTPVRAFFAIYPDEAARGELADVAPEESDDVRVSDMADWHVTLRFLGPVRAEAIPAWWARRRVPSPVSRPWRCGSAR